MRLNGTNEGVGRNKTESVAFRDNETIPEARITDSQEGIHRQQAATSSEIICNVVSYLM